ncbi:hypothetical protein JNB88_14205 [Rhizobium cauense]|uniref:hypothetical protein n=1 Tax=Rhizobium cauense TaxID=1166683 RepID=UPI001C6EC775|nr:hypothetical protein [Rhizobium cauense]MBW9114793.1 hypothetical protein [Rhizobium cauense]
MSFIGDFGTNEVVWFLAGREHFHELVVSVPRRGLKTFDVSSSAKTGGSNLPPVVKAPLLTYQITCRLADLEGRND